MPLQGCESSLSSEAEISAMAMFALVARLVCVWRLATPRGCPIKMTQFIVHQLTHYIVRQLTHYKFIVHQLMHYKVGAL